MRHKLSFVAYTTNVAENRCKPYIPTLAHVHSFAHSLAHTRQTGWSPRCPHSLRWFFAAKERRERSSPLLNPSPAYVVERCSLPLSLGHCSRSPDQKRSNIAPYSAARKMPSSEHVMILYRRPSENDGGFPVADLPISILNGRLGLRTLKGICDTIHEIYNIISYLCFCYIVVSFSYQNRKFTFSPCLLSMPS